MAGIDTVLFDFDGTIMDTNDIIMMSWQHTYRTVTGEEGDRDRIMKTFGEPLVKSLEDAFPDVPLERTLKIYRDFHKENFRDSIRLFPGMKDILGRLRDRGCRTGLATSRTGDTARMCLEEYGLDEYLDAVVTADDTDRHKPDPEPVLMTMERLGSSADSTIYVGDTMFDILCACNAGVASVLVSWSRALGGMDLDDFEDGASPDYIIERPEDILGII